MSLSYDDGIGFSPPIKIDFEKWMDGFSLNSSLNSHLYHKDYELNMKPFQHDNFRLKETRSILVS